MGINSGEALVGATKIGGGQPAVDVHRDGPTTSVAARFAGSAPDGEIIVGPTTASASAQFVLESLGERAFKNVSQPIHVYRVIPPGCTRRSCDRRPRPGRHLLVGRSGLIESGPSIPESP